VKKEERKKEEENLVKSHPTTTSGGLIRSICYIALMYSNSPNSATIQTVQRLPDSAMVIARAFDSSRAVTHRWRSTSELAFRWKVRVPLWEMTMLQESPVWINELARLIVPRHVC